MAKQTAPGLPHPGQGGKVSGNDFTPEPVGRQGKNRLSWWTTTRRSQAVVGIESAEIHGDHRPSQAGNRPDHGSGVLPQPAPGLYGHHHLPDVHGNKVDIEPKIAGLLCSAIVSDTLLFRSPTCTPVDEMAARSLAAIAGLDIEKYAMEMFGAGSNLKDKSDEEIFYQDFKKFLLARR